MGLIDLVGYAIIITLIFVTVYLESKHFVCDSLSCSMYQWSREGVVNDKEFYNRLIDGQTNQSVWMRSYYLAAIITLVVYWWFCGCLPPVIYFLALLIMIFFVIYFGMTFYQHHFLSPINRDLRGYINASCSQDDRRKIQEPSTVSLAE